MKLEAIKFDVKRVAVLVGGLAATGLSMADTTIDLAPINAAITTITSVGTAVFGVVVAVKTFKWIRGAL